MRAHEARHGDAEAIAAIYNAGMDERTATFETRHRSPEEVRQWIGGRHPVMVVEDRGGAIIAFAASSAYRPGRECYDGVAEFSVYTAPDARRRGAARLAMDALLAEAERRGFWKLLSRVFVDNDASRRLLTDLGFREVGVYRRHGRLDDRWRDVVIVEALLGPARD